MIFVDTSKVWPGMILSLKKRWTWQTIRQGGILYRCPGSGHACEPRKLRPTTCHTTLVLKALQEILWNWAWKVGRLWWEYGKKPFGQNLLLRDEDWYGNTTKGGFLNTFEWAKWLAGRSICQMWLWNTLFLHPGTLLEGSSVLRSTILGSGQCNWRVLKNYEYWLRIRTVSEQINANAVSIKYRLPASYN